MRKIKGKTAVVLAVLMLGVMLVGCGGQVDEQPILQTSEASTEVVLEEESVTETSEVIEEALEENLEVDAEENVCTAEDIMTLVDTLTAKYIYDDPEHIKAMIIAANLDYIPEEELDILLATYGYAIEELNQLLYDGVYNISNSL